jgi:hypothetical protein
VIFKRPMRHATQTRFVARIEINKQESLVRGKIAGIVDSVAGVVTQGREMGLVVVLVFSRRPADLGSMRPKGYCRTVSPSGLQTLTTPQCLDSQCSASIGLILCLRLASAVSLSLSYGT